MTTRRWLGYNIDKTFCKNFKFIHTFYVPIHTKKKWKTILNFSYHEILKDLVDGTCTRRTSSEHKTAAAVTGSCTCDSRRRRFDHERQRVISKRRYATKRTLFRLNSLIKNALVQVPPPLSLRYHPHLAVSIYYAYYSYIFMIVKINII